MAGPPSVAFPGFWLVKVIHQEGPRICNAAFKALDKGLPHVFHARGSLGTDARRLHMLAAVVQQVGLPSLHPAARECVQQGIFMHNGDLKILSESLGALQPTLLFSWLRDVPRSTATPGIAYARASQSRWLCDRFPLQTGACVAKIRRSWNWVQGHRKLSSRRIVRAGGVAGIPRTISTVANTKYPGAAFCLLQVFVHTNEEPIGFTAVTMNRLFKRLPAEWLPATNARATEEAATRSAIWQAPYASSVRTFATTA